MTPPARIGDISFWYADIGLPPRRAAFRGDQRVDICIIGAGYTGLWTAWYLRAARPDLEIAILEKEFAGFGASGRNGGWLTGGFAWNHARYAAGSSAAAVREMVAAMNGTVDEVIAVAESQGIEADILRCEEMMVATNPAQMERMRAEAAHRIHWGEEGRIYELSAAEVAERITIPDVLGAMVVRNVARVQPAKLVQGLAAAVERTGVRIYEDSAAIEITPGRVMTAEGVLHAGKILRCTEGFTASLPGHKRDWLPLNSAQIITAPLSAETWAKIGWEGHEILGDFNNAYCYCQRTREGRIAVGARGVPYKFGSAIDANGTPDPETIRRLQRILARYFPAAQEAPIDHAWCGVLGVPRDWCATVSFDPSQGIGYAGGYVGTGVSTSNLAGRSLADLALGRETPVTRLPWINRPLRKWEPEPLRYLGVTGMYALLNAADRAEAKSGATRGSWLASLGNRLAGRG